MRVEQRGDLGAGRRGVQVGVDADDDELVDRVARVQMRAQLGLADERDADRHAAGLGLVEVGQPARLRIEAQATGLLVGVERLRVLPMRIVDVEAQAQRRADLVAPAEHDAFAAEPHACLPARGQQPRDRGSATVRACGDAGLHRAGDPRGAPRTERRGESLPRRTARARIVAGRGDIGPEPGRERLLVAAQHADMHVVVQHVGIDADQ